MQNLRVKLGQVTSSKLIDLWLFLSFSFFSEIKVTFGNKTIVETVVVKTLTNQQRENRQSDNRSSRGCLEQIESTTVED